MTQIKLRRDTSSAFASSNPILGNGEPAYETDTKKLKIGDGTTAYTQLDYFSAGGGGSGTNIPLAFGMSQYYKGEMNNVSWLKSVGQQNTKALYPDFYAWVLEKANAGTDGFKLSAATDITDYDFVINTTDETFRLPLLDGSENLPSNTVLKSIGNATLPVGTTDLFTASHNGNVSIKVFSTTGGNTITASRNDVFVGTAGFPPNAYNQSTISFDVKRGDVVSVNLDSGTATYNYVYSKAVGNGSLYYYCGNTTQNETLINVGAITEALATKTDMLQASGAGMSSDKHIDLTLGASGSTYTAPANGWFTLRKVANSDGGANDKFCDMYNNTTSIGVHNDGMYGFQFVCTIPASKGDIVQINYNATGKTNLFRFVYAEGSK